MNESISESISQSVNRSINQSIDQSSKQSINQTIHQSTNRSINESIHQSINESIIQSGIYSACRCYTQLYKQQGELPRAFSWVLKSFNQGCTPPADFTHNYITSRGNYHVFSDLSVCVSGRYLCDVFVDCGCPGDNFGGHVGVLERPEAPKGTTETQRERNGAILHENCEKSLVPKKIFWNMCLTFWRICWCFLTVSFLDVVFVDLWCHNDSKINDCGWWPTCTKHSI